MESFLRILNSAPIMRRVPRQHQMTCCEALYMGPQPKGSQRDSDVVLCVLKERMFDGVRIQWVKYCCAGLA